MTDLNSSTALSSATADHAQPPAPAQTNETPKGPENVSDTVERALSKAMGMDTRTAETAHLTGHQPQGQPQTTQQAPSAQDPNGQPRNPDGTFAPKQAEGQQTQQQTQQQAQQQQQAAPEGQEAQTPRDISQPLERVSQDVKDMWGTLPQNVQGEFHRLADEMQQGIDKYKASYEPWKEIDEQAKANGLQPTAIIEHYTGLENLFQQNPMEGFKRISEGIGTTFEAVAQQALGLEARDLQAIQGLKNGQYKLSLPGQSAPNASQQATQGQTQQPGTQTPQTAAQQPQGQMHPDMAQLMNIVQAQAQQLESLKQGIESDKAAGAQQARQQAAMQQIEQFKASGNAPRYDELAPAMGQLLSSGMASDLPSAYRMAEQLNPAQAPAQTLQPAPHQQQPAAQTRDPAAFTMTGAPTSGSNPHERAPSKSVSEAVNSAFEQTFKR